MSTQSKSTRLTTTSNPSTSWRLSGALTLLLASAAALQGAEFLAAIPADCAGVMVFGSLDELNTFIEKFRKGTGQGATGPTVSTFEGLVGGPIAGMDGSRPIAILLTRPYFDPDSMVVVAQVAERDEPEEAAPAASQPADRGARRRNPGERGPYTLKRDGVVFASRNRRAIRGLRDAEARPSLSSALDAEQRAMLTGNHVAVHLPLAQWTPRLKPYIKVFAAAMQFSMQTSGEAGQLDADSQRALNAMWSYGLGKVEGALEQAQSVTVAISGTKDGLRLQHHVAFSRGTPIARYLSIVKRRGIDLFASMPDEPFMMLVSDDWATPPENSMMVDMAGHLLSEPAFTRNMAPEKLKKLRALMTECYGQMQGGGMLMTAPDPKDGSTSIFGTYFFDDPRKGQVQLGELSQLMPEMMLLVNPAGGFWGPARTASYDGVSFEEVALNMDNMKDPFRQEMCQLYGEKCVYRSAVLGKDLFAYTVSDEPDAFQRVVRTYRSGQGITRRPSVRRVLEALPKDPNVVLVLNVEATLDFAQRSANQASGANDTRTERPLGEALVGWALTVRPAAVSGQAWASYEDIGRIAKLVTSMADVPPPPAPPFAPKGAHPPQPTSPPVKSPGG